MRQSCARSDYDKGLYDTRIIQCHISFTIVLTTLPLNPRYQYVDFLYLRLLTANAL